MMSLHWTGSGMGVRAAVILMLLLLVGVTQAMQRRSASASPTPTPDPNLAALTGLGGGGIGAISGGGASSNGNGNGGTCNNQDLLTNLLVYQYLSGSIPNGGPPGSNPQLHALLGSAGPATTTVTSVSTTLTTLVVEVEPSTHYMTSTTSYVTTLTSVETKIIPVLFRGSKITTTISESSEEVITATEFFTETSVHSPSIVQTLPVHITMTATSTRGLNGQYTLHELTPGPTSVIHQPVSTTTFDFDAAGLDIGSLDLSQIDIASLTSGGLAGLGLPGDDNQMLSVLSSLLQNYDDAGAADAGFDSFPGTRFGSNGRSADGRRKNPFSSRRTRFEDTFQNDYADYDAPVDDPPKFNVLPGFTLSDRVASSGSSSGSGSGSAATDTRYSKYHRKDRVDNNGIATTTDANTREGERFSASTRRRTFSRTSNNQRPATEDRTSRPPSTRFVPAAESQYFEDGPPKFRPFGARSDREISSRRRSGVQDTTTSTASRPSSSARPKATQRQEVPAETPTENVRTTVLTMYLSGTVPGEFSTSLRTVTLRSLATRRRRDTSEEPVTKIATTASSSLPITENTILPDVLPGGVNSKEIVNLLKTLDPAQVKQMLKSLQKWVDYYNHELLDEVDNKQEIKRDTQEETKINDAPQLTSSINVENTETENVATTALPLSPSAISGEPSSSMLCYPPPTVTETVYRTFVITSGLSPA